MSDQRIKNILLHMLEDLTDIQKFTEGFDYQRLLEDKLVSKAIGMCILNIGEGVKNLPTDFHDQNADVPWKSIVAMRNRVAHGYHSLDYEIVWGIVKNDVPQLIPVIQKELRRMREKEEPSR